MAPVNSGVTESSLKHFRTVARVNSRVPVAVEWTADGKALRAEGVTLDVSTKGCLAVVPQGFAVGQSLRLINLANKQGCDAVLVWRGHEGHSGWELGLELLDPPTNFWNLEF